MLARSLVPLALLALAVGACTESGYTTGRSTPVTAVVVDPAEFLGDVVCLASAGGMQRYVATLIDVSPVPVVADAADVILPSSEPTECWKSVHFLRLTQYRDYVAEIDGYDRTDLSPASPGSRVQLDAEGRYVAPRWTTSCGRLDEVDGGGQWDGGLLGRSCVERGDAAAGRATTGGPTCSVPVHTSVVRSCAPLVDASGAPPRTGLSVALGAISGTAACDGDAGPTSFNVTLLGSAELPRVATCADTVTFEGLAGGTGYTVGVTALDATGRPVAASSCFRRVVAGTVLPAACDPLVPVP